MHEYEYEDELHKLNSLMKIKNYKDNIYLFNDLLCYMKYRPAPKTPENNKIQNNIENKNWGAIYASLEKDFTGTLKQKPDLFEDLIESVTEKNDFYIIHIFTVFEEQINNYYKEENSNILLIKAFNSESYNFCSFLIEKEINCHFYDKDSQSKKFANIMEVAIKNKIIDFSLIKTLWEDKIEMDINKITAIILSVLKRNEVKVTDFVFDKALEKNIKPYVLFDEKVIKSCINKKIDFVSDMNAYQENFIKKLEFQVLIASNNSKEKSSAEKNKKADTVL